MDYAELQMKHTVSHWSRIIRFLHEPVYMSVHTRQCTEYSVTLNI